MRNAGLIVLEIFSAAAGESCVEQLRLLENRFLSRFVELIRCQVGVAAEGNSHLLLVLILLLLGMKEKLVFNKS